MALILLLLNIFGTPYQGNDPWDKNTSMDPAQISALLGLLLHITRPHTLRYGWMWTLFPLVLKFSPTRGLCLGGCIHSPPLCLSICFFSTTCWGCYWGHMLRVNSCSLSTTKSLNFSLTLKDLNAYCTPSAHRFLITHLSTSPVLWWRV